MLELHLLPAYERLALLKALLIANKVGVTSEIAAPRVDSFFRQDTLEHFRFTPTREVSWVGEKIAWKITVRRQRISRLCYRLTRLSFAAASDGRDRQLLERAFDGA